MDRGELGSLALDLAAYPDIARGFLRDAHHVIIEELDRQRRGAA